MKELTKYIVVLFLHLGCTANDNAMPRELLIAYINGDTGMLHMVRKGTDSIVEPGPCVTPEWSLNGERLLYACVEKGHFVIKEYWVASGSVTTVVDLKDRDALLPRYDSFGKIWFMGMHRPDNPLSDDFEICNSSTDKTECLTSPGTFDAYPIPHPIIKDTVYYESGSEGKKEFFGIFMLRGKEKIPLFYNPHKNGNGIPHISGDGRWVTWECSSNSDYEDTYYQVCVIELDSNGLPVGGAMMLTDIRAHANATPRISEDSERIIFRQVADKLGRFGLYEYVLKEKSYNPIMKPTVTTGYLSQQKYLKGNTSFISYEKHRIFGKSRLLVAERTKEGYSEVYISEHPLAPQRKYELYNYDAVWVK